MYTVKNVMSAPLITIEPEATVSDAMRVMAHKEISSLIVPLSEGSYGIITRRDVLGKVVAAGKDQQHVTVREVCTAPIVTIAPDASLRECSARMMDLKVRRLPVRDEHAQLVGIVSETD